MKLNIKSSLRNAFVSLLVILVLGAPAISQAAIAHKRSVIYLDAHDNIIGQQVYYCNNVSHHAGEIDGKNPYKVILEGRCRDSVVHCNPGHGFCPPKPPTDMQVTVFFSATGKSVSFFCDKPHPEGAPFHGADNQCGSFMPMEINFLAPFKPGWTD